MRRWNSWGDPSRDYPLTNEALGFLTEEVGSSTPRREVGLEDVVKKVPASRVTPHQLLRTDPEIRIYHSRGQSLDDWLCLKFGKVDTFPDAVAFPENEDEVRQLLCLAEEKSYKIIPYGGGTSVTGHINPLPGSDPVITVSMRNFSRLIDIDNESCIATIGAGAYGPEIESQLRGKGYVLGHFPQSFELSTLGGWVVTRSSGQQSLRYGRIEQLFAGGQLETPAGTLSIPTFPASAAGPDLREMVLGSEGRLGILTNVKVRVTEIPEKEKFSVYFFPDWEVARNCIRKLVQQKIGASMLRLSNTVETATNLILAGHPKGIKCLEQYLRCRGIGDGKCMLVAGYSGTRKQVKTAMLEMAKALRAVGGVSAGSFLGNKWANSRFKAPYLREALWQQGYIVDTVETAVDWSKLNNLVDKVEACLGGGLDGVKVHVFTHLSHMYSQGASCYTTYVFPVSEDFESSLHVWRTLKSRVSKAIISAGGTISHQHGVGKDHKPYLKHEKSDLGIRMINSVLETVDPDQLMNPGTLI